MAATGQNFEMHAGDRKQIQISVTEEDGSVLDLISFTQITWVIYHQTTKVAVLTKTLGAGITVPTPSNGVILIDLLPADTENISPSLYNHECEISDGSTNVATVTTGFVKILYSKA